MLDENVKAWIRDNVGNSFKRGEIDQAIDLFEMALEIDAADPELAGLNLYYGNILEQMAEAANFKALAANMNSFCRIEQFMKHLFGIIDPTGQDNPPPPLYEGEDRPSWSLAHLYKQAFKIVPADYNLKTQSVRPLDKYPYLQDYVTVYQDRNTESHDYRVYGQAELFTSLGSLLTVYLDLSRRYARQIQQAYSRMQRREMFNRQRYANYIIQRQAEAAKDGFTYIDTRWGNNASDAQSCPIDQLMRRCNTRIIKLQGRPGSGKTTALRRLELLDAKEMLLNERAPIPVFISLADLEAGGRGMLHNQIALLTELPLDLLPALLKEGGVNLYLDGYNEILDNNTKRTLSRDFDRFALNYPKVRVVITERALTRDAIPIAAQARCFQLFPLSDENKAEYFQCNCPDKQAQELLLAQLRQRPGYFQDMNTPMKLKQLVETVSFSHQIPEDPIEAYVNYLLERERLEKRDENVDYLPHFLSALALLPEEAFSRITAERCLARCKDKLGYTIPDTRGCLKLMIDMGLLLEEADSLTFTSKHYRDYFTLSAIISGLGEILEERDHA